MTDFMLEINAQQLAVVPSDEQKVFKSAVKKEESK